MPHCRLPRPLAALTAVLSLAAALWLAAATSPALAHAILEDSDPAIGATVPPGPVAVRLRYNSRIDRGRSRLTLIRADRTASPVPIEPDGPPDIMRARLDLPPGTFTLRWQVLAVDGHVTRGDVPFTVTGP